MLPGALGRIQGKLRGSADGDRQMVAILNAVPLDGLPAVEAACGEAWAAGLCSSDGAQRPVAAAANGDGAHHRYP